MDNGETPDDASERELYEEIGYKASSMHKLGFEVIPDLGNIVSHVYYCPLTVSVNEIKLGEGLDLGLFSLEEILVKKLYSHKMQSFFPVIEVPHFINTIKRLRKHLEFPC